MSNNTGDERWRTQRGPQNNANNNNANNNRQPQRGPASRDRSSANNVTAPQQNRPSSTGQRPAPGAVSGNAWNNGDRPARGGSNVGVMEDEHVPVRGFNAQETRDVLRRGYQDSMSGEQKATVYRAQNADANNARAGGPWNSKPNNMASGQDFFVQLRKAIASLQQSGGVTSPN